MKTIQYLIERIIEIKIINRELEKESVQNKRNFEAAKLIVTELKLEITNLKMQQNG